MFVTVQINSDTQVGTLMCHDADNIWRQSTSQDIAPLAVLTAVEFDEENSIYWGKLSLAGITWVRAGENIPTHGGWLASDDQGRAVVSATEDCGLIAPVSANGSAPQVEDLILVYLR